MKATARITSLTTTLTWYQILLLLKVMSLNESVEVMEEHRLSHNFYPDEIHFLFSVLINQETWEARAQALALENMGLLQSHPHEERWNLTLEGRALCDTIVHSLLEQLPQGLSLT